MNLSEAKEVLFRTHLAALDRGSRASGYVLEALPGVGKSEGTFQYAEQLARELNEPVGLVQFMLTTITSADVRGFMLPLKAEAGQPLRTVFSTPPWYPVKNNIWVVVPVADAGTDAYDTVEWCAPGEWTGEVPRVGVLFLDEWGQADEDVKKPAAELILHGNVGTTYLPIGWRVVAAQNRMSDRSGTVREMMFIVNRRGLLPVEPSLPGWLNWVDGLPSTQRPHYMTVSFARKNPDIVFSDRIPETPDPFCTPRSLVIADRELQALSSEDDRAHGHLPMSDLAREVCAGWIGQGAAGQFYAHLRYAEVLPDMEDIESSPRDAKLPPGKDAQMVCAYMLAHHINEDNAQNVLKYIMRLSQEMQIMAVGIIFADEKKRKFMVPHREYNVWLSNNKDVLIAAQG